MCIEYCIQVNMYHNHVSAQGIDERMIKKMYIIITILLYYPDKALSLSHTVIKLEFVSHTQ